MPLREDANQIIKAALSAAMPDAAVHAALENANFPDGRLVLIATGKAGWQMAKAAYDLLGERINHGVVVTKYGHSRGEIGNLEIYEAGHPVPDGNSLLGTQMALNAVADLKKNDTVLFLLSGGGSALFEKPLIPEIDLSRVTGELLACGADITEINTVRKRFSAVKGGRFALACHPAQVFTIVLSDVLGDRLDVIASGPAYPDSSTAAEACEIARKYNLTLTPQMEQLLHAETPKKLDNVTTCVTGSVRQLCTAAEQKCRELGYETVMLTDCLSCEARDAGVQLSDLAPQHAGGGKKAFIAGGETVVRVTGNGLGGRNQELALAAAPGISGLNAAVFSVGSDGTDGPTDAAGGYVDTETAAKLNTQGIRVSDVLADNDAYHALQKCGGLIFTGPTGTNVNDISVLLIGE